MIRDTIHHAIHVFILYTAVFLCAACADDAVEMPVYVMRTPEKYREMAVVVPDGSTTTAAGAGSTGVFVEGRVIILPAYGIARFETTWELWEEVHSWAHKNGYTIANKGAEGHGSSGTGGDVWAATTRIIRPVTGITWRDAVVWCNAYSEISGLTPCYYQADGTTVLRVSKNNTQDAPDAVDTEADAAVLVRENNGYRLPLEAEWEFAAHGGVRTAADWNYTYSGGNGLDDTAWFSGNAAEAESPSYGAHAVGSKKGGAYNGANKLGVFDMSGNAAEWCWDWYNERPISVETPPAGDGPGLTPSRITRGGSWKAAAALCTVKSRQYSRPFYSADDLGFRVARSLQTDGDVSNSGDYPPTLVGSRWMWDSPWGLRILTFDTASHADFYEGWDDSHNDVDYVYNSGTGTGDITGPYAPGSFKLKNNNKTMHFPLYMNFGHSADYTLMEDEEGG